MTKKRRKRHTPEQIVARLRDADAMLNAGKDLSVVLQTLEIAEATNHPGDRSTAAAHNWWTPGGSKRILSGDRYVKEIEAITSVIQ